MKKCLLFALAFTCISGFQATAQAPQLPTKATLSQTILSGKTFTSASQVDTVKKNHPIGDSYTLEVVAKVNSATGKGLDLEARDAKVKGFRLSLDAASLKWTAPLTATQTLSSARAGESHTIRVAVANNQAHIYQNGAFIKSQPVAVIKDMVAGVEKEEFSDKVGTNLLSNWAGTAPNNTGRPNDYGWAYTGTTNTTLFNTANAGSGVRYIDVSETVNKHTLNGATYNGRIMFIRWDSEATRNTVYSYPVTLEANTTYDFSMLHSYWSNSTGGRTMTVGIGKTVAATDRMTSQIFNTTGTATLKRESLIFTSQEAGTYYLTFTGDWGLFSIAELAVNKLDVKPRFVFGKNYPDGAVDMEILSATYEAGAFAPAAVVNGPKENMTVTGAKVFMPTAFNTHFIVPGKTELHFTGEPTPFVNSSVELSSNDAWLFFDNVKPATVISSWLGMVTVNGARAVNNQNVRVAIYKNGAVVIPNGNLTNNEALEVFTQANLSGESRTLAIETYHNNLGTFNDAIKSFKLKRGYMATLATNADGSGYSRVFIANDEDLVVNTMPEGLEGTVSFVRVFRWDWVSKKGKAGWDPHKLNATWYYDWNIGGNSSPNVDYVIIRQHGGWPAFTDINNKRNVNHVLGHNEPDRPDQADMTVDQVLAQWPEMMKSGLRIGSPAPSDPFNGWLPQFLAKSDAMNYRIDFVAIHCYWGGLTPRQWYDRLLNVYNTMGKRPLWITEWNNGANWTTEAWPADQAAQFEKQLNDMKGILQVLDTASFVERYAIYDWVENKRAMVLADTLTPAGKYYAANKSNFAFTPSRAYVHTWKLLPATLSSAINTSDYSKVTLSWRDMNGDMGSKYVLERRINGVDTEYQTVQEYTTYTAGGVLTYQDDVYARAAYRIKAFNKDGSQFVYSPVLEVVMDAAPIAPGSVTGEVISSSNLKVMWNAVTGARSYNLKRSSSPDGPFEVILARTALREFVDVNRTPGTTYYYAVTSLNSAGESANSAVLELRTRDLVAPSMVVNPRIASADGKVVLTWDFMYDAKYDILRSETQNGTYTPVATNVEGLRYEDLNRVNYATYYYKIVAHNAVGRSPESTILVARPAYGQHTYLSFNETTGAMAEDVWGGYHGTLAAAAVREEGKVGRALKMDGTATSFASLAPGVVSGLNDFTISTWVKMNAFSNWMRIFDFGTGTNQYLFLSPQVNVVSGKSTVRYAIKNGGAEQTVSFAYTFPLNTWAHIAITQQENTAKLYINGELVATNTAVTIKPAQLGITSQNYIGKSQFNDPLLNGSVDEFRIYNYAFSEENIMKLATNTPLSSGSLLDAAKVVVYPNPTTSALNISGLGAKTYTYVIYSTVGGKVAEGTLKNGKITVPATVANGNYLLQIFDDGKPVVRKQFILQK